MFFKKTKIKLEQKLDEINFYIKNTNQKVYDLSYSIQELSLLKTKVDDLEKQNTQLQKNYKDLLDSYKKSEVLRERAYDVLAKLATAEEVSKLAEQENNNSKETANVLSKLATSADVSRLATSEQVLKLATSEEVGKLATAEIVAKLATSEEVGKLATAELVAKLAEQENNNSKETADVLSKLATSADVSKLATAELVTKLVTVEESSNKTIIEDIAKLATADEIVKLSAAEEKQRIQQDKNLENRVNNRINDSYKRIRYKLYKFMDKENWEQATIDDAFEVTKQLYNLDNPQTLNEKVCWLKLYDRRPIMTTVADKYAVRDFVVAKTGNEDLLVELLGVYDNFDQINFDKLPDQFVIKTNHGSGYNLICKDKATLNIEETKKTVEGWLAQDFSYVALEPHYLGIKKKILIEKYMENGEAGLDDYKVFCFNGKPKVIFYITGRFTKKQCAFFDINWNRLPYTNDGFETLENDVRKPEKLNFMLDYAKKLSEEFTVARVDFYVLNSGELKLGEITLTPAAGRSRLSENADVEMGKMIKLPDLTPSVYKKNQ